MHIGSMQCKTLIIYMNILDLSIHVCILYIKFCKQIRNYLHMYIFLHAYNDLLYMVQSLHLYTVHTCQFVYTYFHKTL